MPLNVLHSYALTVRDDRYHAHHHCRYRYRCRCRNHHHYVRLKDVCDLHLYKLVLLQVFVLV